MMFSPVVMFVILMQLFAAPVLSASHAFPLGSFQHCSNEGQEIHLKMLQDHPCISCKCMAGIVVCKRQHCPNSSCYLTLAKQNFNGSSTCCEQCKGCFLNGTQYQDGYSWHSEDDPCLVSQCRDGIITHSRQQCVTPCGNPLPPLPGKCCPRCSLTECQHSDISQPPANMSREISTRNPLVRRDNCYTDITSNSSSPDRSCALGDERLKDDPCVQCSCDSSGNVVCVRLACPVLACSLSRTVQPRGQCCPVCRGVRRVREDSRQCHTSFGRVRPGDLFAPDSCTDCRCEGSTGVCQRRTCPLLDCARHLQVRVEGDCCSICRQPQRVRRYCRHKRRVVEEGASWKMGACTQCRCESGEIKCHQHVCPALSCPFGYHAAKLDGQCCRRCVEDDAICTVFGDPHYNTFDGRLYNFQGTCRYMLAKDCVGGSFSVRVANDARNSRLFSWTKTAFIKVKNTRITLKQNFKVKVNGEDVKLPFVELGEVTIYQNPKDNYNVLVNLASIGVSVTWDGDSFLQVKVPPVYKGRMCGLCGNFNGNKTDEWTTRRHKIASSASQFARSWRVGGAKFCSRAVYPHEKRRKWRRRQKLLRMMAVNRQLQTRATRLCAILSSHKFSQCHSNVDVTPYLKSCVQDVLECSPKQHCFCEPAAAYAHACQQLGVDTTGWANQTQCQVHL